MNLINVETCRAYFCIPFITTWPCLMQFWTHSDADGFFYVIKLDDVGKHSGKPIQAKVEEANHGKLLWDEDSHLNRHGYATSTGETHLFILDMISKEQIGTYDFSSDVDTSICGGTHAIAYSNLNKHLYLECTDGGGAIELDISDPTNPKFVTQHDGATGALYETPDEAFVVASDKGASKLHIFRPNGNGTASSIDYVVDVPGHPSTVSFWPVPGGDKDHDFIACMPLTENTNRNHMDENGNIVCDYYGCSGASTPEDVANGICHYDSTGRSLQEATIDQIEQVKSGEEPFGSVCAHCEDEKNYLDGVCECTPFCGTCGDADYDASNSGVSCVSLSDVVAGRTDTATLIKGAGSVLQGSPYAYSPQCGFGRTYRTHKRGGAFDASVANFPTNSLQIVNMEKQSLHCAVDLPGAPSRVIYVPPQEGQNISSTALSAGGIAGIVVGCLAVVFIVGFLVYRRRSGRKDQPESAGSPSHSAGHLNGDNML